MTTFEPDGNERRSQDRAEKGIHGGPAEQAYNTLFDGLERLPEPTPPTRLRRRILESVAAIRRRRRRETRLLRGMVAGIGGVLAASAALSMPRLAGLLGSVPALVLFSIAVIVLVGLTSARAARQPLIVPDAAKPET